MYFQFVGGAGDEADADGVEVAVDAGDADRFLILSSHLHPFLAHVLEFFFKHFLFLREALHPIADSHQHQAQGHDDSHERDLFQHEARLQHVATKDLNNPAFFLIMVISLQCLKGNSYGVKWKIKNIDYCY